MGTRSIHHRPTPQHKFMWNDPSSKGINNQKKIYRNILFKTIFLPQIKKHLLKFVEGVEKDSR